MGATHTPGPWVVESSPTSHSFNRVYSSANGHPVHYLYNTAPPNFATEQANARLIAAAPDLLEACQALVSSYTVDMRGGAYALSLLAAARELAEAAISKARPLPSDPSGYGKGVEG